MRRSTRIAATLALAGFCAALAACEDSTGPAANIDGDWELAAAISNSSIQVSCQVVGTVSIFQDGDTFNGEIEGSTETCMGPGGTITGNVDGAITGGQISGRRVTYTDGFCNYDGTASGSPANRITGSVNCTVPVQGTNYPFSGTFTVSR